MDQPTSKTESAVDLDEFLGVQPASPRRRYIRLGLIALGVIAVLWILSRFFFGGSTEAAFVTRPVQRGNLEVSVSATGNIQPTNEVEVGSELSGLITRVNVDNNDRVTQGQVLAMLDTSRLQDSINQRRAALQAAQASVMQARATADQSRANLNRFQEVYRLSGGKVPSGTEMDTARA
jgi:HlyD family secretion protein